MADNTDFLEQQRRAIERMNEMHLKQQIKTGGYKMPPAPSFVKINNNFESVENNTYEHSENTNAPSQRKTQSHPPTPKTHKTSSFKQNGFSLPFLSGGRLDGDISLILGLILILANEKADRKLLLALLYILF